MAGLHVSTLQPRLYLRFSCFSPTFFASLFYLPPALAASPCFPLASLQLYMNCIDVSITNAATPPSSQQVTGKRTVFANQPGYPTIPEFGLGYDGSDIYAAAPTITITATGTSGGAGASPSSSPAVVVVASPSTSASKPAVAASPSASASRAAASPAAASASPSPVPLASVLPSGSRILDYLHARGEALDITTPAPVKAVYADYRDSE